MFITDIRGLKINAVSREEVYEKASKLFGAENQDLVVQLRELLYNVWNVDHNTHEHEPTYICMYMYVNSCTNVCVYVCAQNMYYFI